MPCLWLSVDAKSQKSQTVPELQKYEMGKRVSHRAGAANPGHVKHYSIFKEPKGEV